MLDILLPTAAALSLLNAISLLCKSEAYRGLGRIAGGAALILLGCYLSHLLPFITGQTTQYFSAWLVLASGVVTLASGARKFLRRNLSQPS